MFLFQWELKIIRKVRKLLDAKIWMLHMSKLTISWHRNAATKISEKVWVESLKIFLDILFSRNKQGVNKQICWSENKIKKLFYLFLDILLNYFFNQLHCFSSFLSGSISFQAFLQIFIPKVIEKHRFSLTLILYEHKLIFINSLVKYESDIKA